MYGEKYGVPRDIYAKIKIIGLLILDITFVGITGLIALSVGLRIFPKSQWIQMFAFIFLTPVMSCIWCCQLTVVKRIGTVCFFSSDEEENVTSV